MPKAAKNTSETSARHPAAASSHKNSYVFVYRNGSPLKSEKTVINGIKYYSATVPSAKPRKVDKE